MEAGWFIDGSESQGFLFFETTSLPSTTTVTSAKLTGCHNAGPGVVQARLYTASFVFPISLAAWDSAKVYLKTFSALKGSQTLVIAVTAVNKGASTQFSIKYPKPASAADVYKRFATATGIALGTVCPAKTPWALQVIHCGP